jgi:hypothetical protein
MKAPSHIVLGSVLLLAATHTVRSQKERERERDERECESNPAPLPYDVFLVCAVCWAV